MLLQLTLTTLACSVPPASGPQMQTFDVTDFGATPDAAWNDDAIGIRDAIESAMTFDGDAEVVFPPGTYHLKSSEPTSTAQNPPRAAFGIGPKYVDTGAPDYKAHSVTLSGDGATLILVDDGTNQMDRVRAIDVDNVDGLTLSGPTIDYQDALGRPSTFTLCEITGFTVGGSGAKIQTRVTILDGYAEPITDNSFTNYGHNHVFEPATNELAVHAPTRDIKSIELTDPVNGEYTITHLAMGAAFDSSEVGQILALPEPQTFVAIRLFDVDGLTIQGLTLLASPHFGIHSIGCTDVFVDQLSVVPGPPPPGATRPRLISVNRDGLHVQSPRGAVSITDSVFAYTGDDSIAVHGWYYRALGPGVPVDPRDPSSPIEFEVNTGGPSGSNYPVVGDPIRVYAPWSGVGTPTITDTTIGNVTPVSGTNARIQLDPHVPVQDGTLLSNLAAAADGLIVSGCSVTQAGSRGMLLHSTQCLVADNTVHRTLNTGIAFHSSLYWQGIATPNSGVPGGVMLFQNEVSHAAVREGGSDSVRGSITVIHATPEEQNWPSDDLINGAFIVDNVIRNAHGPSVMVSNSTLVEIVGNDFCNPKRDGAWVDGDRCVVLDAIVDLDYVAQVLVSDNHIYGLNGSLDPVVAWHQSCIGSPTFTSSGFQNHAGHIPGTCLSVSQP